MVNNPSTRSMFILLILLSFPLFYGVFRLLSLTVNDLREPTLETIHENSRYLCNFGVLLGHFGGKMCTRLTPRLLMSLDRVQDVEYSLIRSRQSDLRQTFLSLRSISSIENLTLNLQLILHRSSFSTPSPLSFYS